MGDYKDPANLDARLTPKGIEQCKALAATLATRQQGQRQSSTTTATQENGNSHGDDRNGSTAVVPSLDTIDLIVTSSMSRCIDTALQCFPNFDGPVVAHEGLRETVNYVCDRRRARTELEQEYPNIDFDACPADDEIWRFYQDRLPSDWDSHRESAELWRVVERGRVFWDWLAQRSEQSVVVCTHSAFLRCVLSWGQRGGVALQLPQTLDERKDKTNEPLVQYGGDEEFEEFVRKDYANCELRSFVVVFGEKTT